MGEGGARSWGAGAEAGMWDRLVGTSRMGLGPRAILAGVVDRFGEVGA